MARGTHIRLALTTILTILMGVVSMCVAESTTRTDAAFVRVSQRDQRYLELTDGRPYIPIGLNMIAPPGGDLDGMAEWIRKLSANGGNFIRIWLGNPFFDIEHARSGEYDAQKAERIDALLAIARQHDVRVKMCLESFRHFGTRKQAWSAKPLHLVENGGPAKDIADFFDGERSRAQFKRKLAWYADRYGSDPIIFGWELWNEINAVAGGDHMAWTEVMLEELHRLFPDNMAMQSLGSYDNDRKRPQYRRLSTMRGNDVAQVHRYLDLGARLEVCKGPVDVLAADATRELLAFEPGRPVLLAEGGAVEPSHTGPFKLYEKDRAGVILHDVLFAPFFVGAAGPGHIWHWDHYVDKNDLWWQFGRFSEAVKDIDPAAEAFEPTTLSHPRLRIYALKGKQTLLLWCRDSQNTWQSELADGKAPDVLQDVVVDLSQVGKTIERTARAYDPWEDEWTNVTLDGASLRLPAFSRSVVARVSLRQ
ncbi:MAG: cellulase family glycosylhydrolase [Armatimonadota bacterium]